MMRGTVLIAVVAALAVTMVASSDEAGAAAALPVKNVHTMTRSELMKELEESRAALTEHKDKLAKAKTKISGLQEELDAITDEDQYEDNRKANEKSQKSKEKKAAQAKKDKQTKKKEKLADNLMEHVAKFLAFEAAKKTKNKGSVVQKKAILEAARTGGRAGAIKPLKKVARTTAVAAVKKARKAAKKKGTKGKHALRKVSVQAAKDAVHKLMKEQEELVEAAAQKYLKEAVKKYPPNVQLAEDDGKPNKFVAPPTVHLSLAGVVAKPEHKEVTPIKEEKPVKMLASPKIVQKTVKAAPKQAAPKAEKAAPKAAPKTAPVKKAPVKPDAVVPEKH